MLAPGRVIVTSEIALGRGFCIWLEPVPETRQRIGVLEAAAAADGAVVEVGGSGRAASDAGHG